MQHVRPVAEVFAAVQIEYSNMREVCEYLNDKFGGSGYIWMVEEGFIIRFTNSGLTTNEFYVNGDWLIDKHDHFEVISVANFEKEYVKE